MGHLSVKPVPLAQCSHPTTASGSTPSLVVLVVNVVKFHTFQACKNAITSHLTNYRRQDSRNMVLSVTIKICARLKIVNATCLCSHFGWHAATGRKGSLAVAPDLLRQKQLFKCHWPHRCTVLDWNQSSWSMV